MEYKPNSFKSRQEQNQPAERKKIESPVQGKTHAKKKSGASKFFDMFIAEDLKNVKEHIINDVLIPRVREVCNDMITHGSSMIFGVKPKNTGTTKTSTSNTAYNKFSSGATYRNDRTPRDVYRYQDFFIDNRGDAEAVLDQLYEILNHYDEVTVADLITVAGFDTKILPMDSNYGWTSLRSARVVRTSEGYEIDLPRAKALN